MWHPRWCCWRIPAAWRGPQWPGMGRRHQHAGQSSSDQTQISPSRVAQMPGIKCVCLYTNSAQIVIVHKKKIDLCFLSPAKYSCGCCSDPVPSHPCSPSDTRDATMSVLVSLHPWGKHPAPLQPAGELGGLHQLLCWLQSGRAPPRRLEEAVGKINTT